MTQLRPAPFSDDPLEERVVDAEVVHRGRYLEFRVDTIERADGSTRHARRRRPPGRGRGARARRRRPAAARPPVADPGRAGAARDPGRHARRPRRRHRGPGPRRPPRARGGDRPPGGALAQARRVLDRARVRDRADAPVPRDRASTGVARRRPPGARRGRAAGAVARVPLDEALAMVERGEIGDAKSILGHPVARPAAPRRPSWAECPSPFPDGPRASGRTTPTRSSPRSLAVARARRVRGRQPAVPRGVRGPPAARAGAGCRGGRGRARSSAGSSRATTT